MCCSAVGWRVTPVSSGLKATVRKQAGPAVEREQRDEHYRNAKVVLVGNTSVGKSGLGLVLAGRKLRHRIKPWPAYLDDGQCSDLAWRDELCG